MATAAATWVGVLGLGLALPLSFPANAAGLPGTPQDAAVSASADAGVPQRWRNYALASITPKFAWAPAAADATPRVTDAPVSRADIATVVYSISQQPAATLNLSVAHSLVDERVQALASPQLDVRAELPGIGLKRTIVAPSVVSRWGDAGTFGVTGILAYQRFVSLGMGETSLRDGMPLWPVVPGESSYGAGLRFDVGSFLTNRLSWGAAYQSRVNMDALNNLRGVYSDPGQFDIPASASFGVSYALTPALSFDVGVQRVMYSEVTPFTSPALPRRFLALLGSGASPVFAWQDLNVYSAGWTWRDDVLGNLEVRYSTRQQPSPTSALLRTALGSSPADRTIALGYARATGRQSTLSIQAVYSSAPYFLGLPSYRSTNRVTGNQVEYEAAWAMRF